jgi:catechol 2,3-dioxygenase-like lactoylglutathione lyase family enzyme
MGLPNPLGLTAHHITACVLDLERAIDWYQDMLGFKLVERGSRHEGAFQFAELAIQNFGVALVRFNEAAASRTADVLLAPSWLHIVFSVADPDSTYRLLKQRGASVTTRPAEDAGTVSTFIIHDSEGNEIEIVKA